jgi:peptidoglycan-N-acetylglucosamine deacetylase
MVRLRPEPERSILPQTPAPHAGIGRAYNGSLAMTGVGGNSAVPSIAGLAASGAFLAWAVRGRSASVFGDSVWRGPRHRATVALTFDDGPSEGTPRLLEVLADLSAQATFFQCGANVDRLPEVAREVAAAGHEIGNHSYSHPLFCFRDQAFMEAELRRAQQSIAKHAGVEPAWFRAPFGARWFGLGEAQRKLGLRGATWSVIARDWKLDAGALAERVRRKAANGAIICLHDGRELQSKPDIGNTVEAVRRIVPALRERGFSLTTLSGLWQEGASDAVRESRR